jgi:VCBS repeat-containing protein
VLTAQADGTFAYRPDSDFNGPDSFTYRLSDGYLLSAEATVRLDVQAVNYPPIVANDNGTLPEDGTLEIDVLANDSDPDGDALVLVAVGTPQNGIAQVLGDGRVRYTPRADFFGSDQFTYTVADPSGARSVATVTLSVTPVADAPTTSTQEFTSLEDVTLSERLTATNPDGGALSFAVVRAPAHGSLTLGSDGAFEYLPDAGFGGVDSFTFTVGNGAGLAAGLAELTITPVNDAPVAQGDRFELDEEGSLAASVSANDADEEGDPISFELVSGVAHGELVFASDGSFSYQPVANFTGEDRFTYAASDGRLKSVRAVVHLVVRPVNDPPAAFDDVRTMPMNGTLDIDVLANDQDIDGDRLAVVRPGTPVHGTVSLLTDGSLRYVPLANYYGHDSFTYVMADPSGSEAEAEVRIDITRVNSAPSVELQTFFVEENTSLNRQLVASDVDGDALGFTLMDAPGHGSLTLDFDGHFLYVPNPLYFGSDSFTFSVTDGLLSSNGRAEISVTAVNDPPQAVDDVAELAEDGFVLIDVRANDSDPDGDALTISAVSVPEHGMATIDSGRIRYTPDANFFGADSFTYTLSDGKETGTAAVTVKVNSRNDVPTANKDAATVDEDSSVVIDVLANDSDVEGDPLRLLSVSVPAHGKALIESGAVRYTPAANFFGRDSFTYTVTDNKDSSTATVTIDVLPVDDDPVARDDVRTTNEDVSVLIPVLANDSDLDAVGLVVDSLSAAAHGTVAIEGAGVRYVPTADYHGTDGFSYTLRDGKGRTAGASVSVSINPVADSPVAALQVFNTPEDTRFSAHLVATDADGDTLSFALNEAPSHGHLTLGSDGLFEYQPDANFSGRDSFVFRVSDGLTTVPARAEITVEAVNDAPQAVDDVVLLARGSSARFDVRSNDSDVEGDPLTVVLLAGPTRGELLAQADGSFLYTPLAGFSGEDSFQYRASDGHLLSAPATVRLIVSTTNHPPVAVADTADTDEDTPVTIRVLANDTDADNDPLSVVSLSAPLHGSAVVNADGSVAYTPVANYFGTDSFTYRTNDGSEDSDVATVNVTIAPVNDAPVAVDDSATTAEDTPIVLNLVANDTDVDSSTLSVVSLSTPLHGSVVVNADGSVTYTPATAYFGTDTFTYHTSDGSLDSLNAATVTVTVGSVNTPPVAVDDSATTLEDMPVVLNLVANDTDVDSTTLSVVSLTAPLHGSAVVNVDGSVTYTPAANYFGSDTFTYHTSDGSLDSLNAATVTVSVTPVNDAPVPVDDSATTSEDTPLVLNLVGNDTDVDSTALSVVSVTAPLHGSAVVNADGSVTYTPAANYFGTDSFTYHTSDGSLESLNAGTRSRSSRPTMRRSRWTSATTLEDTPLVLNLVANAMSTAPR